jgi:hypothetical protein
MLVTVLPYETFFYAIGNVAAVLGGFTALVGTFRNDSEHRWTPPEVVGIRFMIEHMLAAIALPLFLQPILELSTSEKRLWVVASALLGGFLVLEVVLNVRRLSNLRREGSAPRYPRAMKVVYFPITLVCAATQVANVVLAAPEPVMWGSLWLVANIAIQFHHFVFPRPERIVVRP